MVYLKADPQYFPYPPHPQTNPSSQSLGQGIMNRERSREVRGFRKSVADIQMGVADCVFERARTRECSGLTTMASMVTRRDE